MRYRSFEVAGLRHLAVLKDGDWLDMGQYDLMQLLQDGSEMEPEIPRNAAVVDFAKVKLLPPVPNPGKTICVGLNYVDHAAESPYDSVPDYPAFFPRFTSSLIAHGDHIIRPECSHELDYEGELVAVIGKKGRNLSEGEALAHVAGYSIFNDASIRNYQFLSAQWTPGKNFDDTGAFGPEFVTADELPEGAIGLTLEVFLNGTMVQTANTKDMAFSVAQIVEKASGFTTLYPGDLLVTGTPGGVGFARNPPMFMKHGDVCEVRIEKIGTLKNTIRDETGVPENQLQPAKGDKG